MRRFFMAAVMVPAAAAVGCGTGAEPICEPTIGIAAQGVFTAGGVGPNIFVVIDSLTPSRVGGPNFDFLRSVLIDGQPTGDASAVWSIVQPVANFALTFQVGGSFAPNDSIPVVGGATGGVGRGPAITPVKTVRFRLVTPLGDFAATDGVWKITAVAPLTASLVANLKTSAGAAGDINTAVGFIFRGCPGAT